MRATMLVLVCLGMCDCAGMSALPFDVVELPAVDAAQRLASGTLSSRALTEAYLDRIARIDRAGPTLNAIIELNPDALAEADALDAELRAGKLRGPLHGLPILIKDNIDVLGMVCSAGSLALADNRPVRDAFVVARLRAAGAVILGKSNLSEWANMRSTRSTSGWSSRGGQTKNPYVLDRNPSGSSSGTAAGISASLAAIGVGTETDGSILSPAAVNGLVGLKPTLGLISRGGIIPIAISQDTAGPMGRGVADVALLLGAMAGADDADPRGPDARQHVMSDYLGALSKDALAGKRLGLVQQAHSGQPDVDAMMERVVATLRQAGAEVIVVTIPTWGSWGDNELEVLLYEFKAGLDAYLGRTIHGPHSLAELIAWNSAHAEMTMPFFAQERLVMAAAKGPLNDPHYLAARADALRSAGPEGLLAALDADDLDALVVPTEGPAFPTDPLLGDHFTFADYSIAAVAGTPSITVPAGHARGLPLGVTFMGRAWSEPLLLGIAYAFEQATRARFAPTFEPTLTF